MALTYGSYGTRPKLYPGHLRRSVEIHDRLLQFMDNYRSDASRANREIGRKVFSLSATPIAYYDESDSSDRSIAAWIEIDAQTKYPKILTQYATVDSMNANWVLEGQADERAGIVPVRKFATALWALGPSPETTKPLEFMRFLEDIDETITEIQFNTHNEMAIQLLQHDAQLSNNPRS